METMTVRALPSKAFGMFLLSTLPLHAQNRIWVVAPQPGPGVDFTRVQDAVDAAALRDTVLIRDGYYQETRLTIRKGITLVAENPFQAMVEAVTEIIGLPAGQALCIQGLRLMGNFRGPAPEDLVAVRILACQGAVSLVGCSIRSGGIGNLSVQEDEGAVHVDLSTSVVLEDCRVERVGYPRKAATFWRSSQASILRGSYPAGDTCRGQLVPAQAGILVAGSSLFLADVDVSGGSCLASVQGEGGPGLVLAGATVWIKAPWPGTIRGGAAGGYLVPMQGGHGLVADASSTVFLDGMPFAGGMGSPSNPPGPPGDPMRTARPVLPRSQPLFTRSPARFPRGEDTTLEVEAGPNELHGIVMTASLQPRALPPGQADPFWVLQSPSWLLAALLRTDGQGRARVAVRVPSTPHLAGQPVWVQDIGVTSNLEIVPSAVLGGPIW